MTAFPFPCPEPDESNPQSHTPHYKIHFNIIVPSMPRSPTWSLRFRYSDLNSVRVSRLSHAYCMTHPPHPPLCDHPR
jgi:hypothetical protein